MILFILLMLFAVNVDARCSDYSKALKSAHLKRQDLRMKRNELNIAIKQINKNNDRNKYNKMRQDIEKLTLRIIHETKIISNINLRNLKCQSDVE